MGSPDGRKRDSEPARSSLSERQKGRIQVEDAGKRRPFMRGIMIHSLMARGIAFDEAFHAANEVRSRVGERLSSRPTKWPSVSRSGISRANSNREDTRFSS